MYRFRFLMLILVLILVLPTLTGCKEKEDVGRIAKQAKRITTLVDSVRALVYLKCQPCPPCPEPKIVDGLVAFTLAERYHDTSGQLCIRATTDTLWIDSDYLRGASYYQQERGFWKIHSRALNKTWLVAENPLKLLVLTEDSHRVEEPDSAYWFNSTVWDLRLLNRAQVDTLIEALMGAWDLSDGWRDSALVAWAQAQVPPCRPCTGLVFIENFWTRRATMERPMWILCPCPAETVWWAYPCRDYCCAELKELKKENWQLQRDNWQLHSQLTKLEMPVDTVYFPDTVYKWVDPDGKVIALNPITRYDTTYQMPPGWWYSIEEFLEWSRRFGVGQIPSWPDSIYILKDIQVGVGR